MAFTNKDIEKARAHKATRETVHEPEVGKDPLSPSPTPDKVRRPRFGRLRTIRLVRLIFVLFLLWYFFGGGLQHQAERGMQDIKEKVAADEVKQYEIAKRHGSAIDACVHAGLVAAAYLQAQEEGSYQEWKGIERSDCAIVGIPQ
jgi:hypothetical protein